MPEGLDDPRQVAAHADAQKIVREWKAGAPQRARAGKMTFWDFSKTLWRSVIHMGMYSSDPDMRRTAMTLTAQDELGRLKQQHAQERTEDAARHAAEIEATARATAQAFFDEAERRGRI